MNAPEHLWYVAYGSNLNRARLEYYLLGGRPPTGAVTYPGCRDRTRPVRDEPVVLPGRLYFALESRAWTGGMAFYDPDADGATAGRAYLLKASQFADIAAQEMHREPGGELDVSVLSATGRHALGPGRYQTLVHLGHRDGIPMVTFTAPWRADDVVHRRPAPAYLRHLAVGLRESHGWDRTGIAGYLAHAAGVPDDWIAGQLTPLIGDRPGDSGTGTGAGPATSLVGAN